MKRTLTILTSVMLTLTLHAQNLMVYRTSGRVTKVENGKNIALKPKDVVSTSTTINVAYESMVEILDEKNAKRYTIKVPGEGTVAKMATAQGNGIKELTAQYITYVKNQLTNNTKMVTAQKYTDFATVTRDSASTRPKYTSAAMQEFMEHRDRLRDDYNAYRRSVNKEYNDFVRKAWTEYSATSPVPMPNERELKPIEFTPNPQQTDRLRFRFRKVKPKPELVIKPEPQPVEQPQPVEEIKEVPTTSLEEKRYVPMPFRFYGTDMAVRLDEAKRFNIGNLSPDRIADVLDMLNSKNYDNVLVDCLKLRTEHNLCDWAYIGMLQEMCRQYCGDGTDEAVLLMGYLLSQSGYKMRYAMGEGHLYLLVGSNCIIYNISAFELDDTYYYPLDANIPSQVYICPASMKGEKCITLSMNPQPRFAMERSEMRTLTAKNKPAFTVDCSVNKNLIDFYNTYPTFELGNNPYTRWSMYANSDMDQEVSAKLYPQLKSLLEGLTPLQSVSQILNWIQYALPYEFDSKVWGRDRIFFSEETLFYPGCDCEDRAILFARLVRDLLHLKCALVYYPGHLAAAVHLSEEVKGDCFDLNGDSYLVCDPTYIGADPGMQMPDMDLEAAKLIILE